MGCQPQRPIIIEQNQPQQPQPIINERPIIIEQPIINPPVYVPHHPPHPIPAPHGVGVGVGPGGVSVEIRK